MRYSSLSTPLICTALLSLFATAQAACSSAYYPVQEGLSRTYQTSMNGKPIVYTETVSRVTPSSFTYLNSMMPSISSTMKCKAIGIVGVQQIVLPGMKITETHGVAWPSRMGVGSRWAYGFTMQGSAEGRSMQQVMEMKSNVVGREKVKVKAGTFNALKVQTTTTMSIVMDGKKMPQPPMQSTAWLAEGVGMVKNFTSGTTVELVKYSKGK